MRNLVLVAAIAIGCGGKKRETTVPEGMGSGSASASASASAAPACTIDLCATYGASLPKVASDLVDQAATDPELGHFFAPVVGSGPDAVAAVKANMASFFAVVYGCADASTYHGKDMPHVHEGLAITASEYDDYVRLIGGVLEANGVPAGDVAACFVPPLTAPAFESQIVGQ